MWGGVPGKEAEKEVAWKEVSRGQTAHLCRISALSTCLPIQEASLALTQRERECWQRRSREGGSGFWGGLKGFVP